MIVTEDILSFPDTTIVEEKFILKSSLAYSYVHHSIRQAEKGLPYQMDATPWQLKVYEYQ